MATLEQKLSPEHDELVAVGASVGAGCHPCVDHHLKAGATAGLDDERLLAAVTSAERVTAEAAVRMGDHVRARLGMNEPALLSPLEQALASLGAALGANDAKSIERHLRSALDSGATRPQLEQAVVTAGTVQENASRLHLRQAERLIAALAVPIAAAGSETASASGCGCGAEEENEALEPGAEAVSPVAEKPSATAPERDGPAAGCADSMAKPFATAGGGEMAGIAAAMANCHRMFGGPRTQSASAAGTDEPPTATTAAASCKKEA